MTRASIFPLSVLLFLAGCGSQSQTRAAFEDAHPYAKVDREIPSLSEGAYTVVIYRDAIPSAAIYGTDSERVVEYTMVYDAKGAVYARKERTVSIK